MKKLLTCLCLTLLLVSGGVQLVQAQTATQSTVVSQDQLLRLEQERALKEEYQNVLDEYITKENEFTETRARYRRFSDLSLEPVLVAQARNLYQLRDRMWLNYLNWVTELIRHYADNGEVVEEVLSLNIDLDQDISTESAEVNTRAIPRSSRTQKQVFLDQLTNLSHDIQLHYQSTNQIVDLESWLQFNQDYGDRIIEEARTILYPIYSYTLLSQVRDLVNDLPDVWQTAQGEILTASANQPLIAAEQRKALDQLRINIADLERKVSVLEKEWSQVQTAGAYESFREQIREMTTLSAQIVAALKALY